MNAPFSNIMQWLRPISAHLRVRVLHTVTAFIVLCSITMLVRFTTVVNDKFMEDNIRHQYMFPPSREAYNLQDQEGADPSLGQSESVLQILGMSRGGFFVECGTQDGETRSNTLFMERNLRWQGLLIEANPRNFSLLIQKHRHCWSINACLSGAESAAHGRFESHLDENGLVAASDNIRTNTHSNAKTVWIDCFPLHMIMRALNRTVVDYLSLDVAGAELEVLAAIRFDLITIRTLSVRFEHCGRSREDEIGGLMTGLGYSVVDVISKANNTVNDLILVKDSEFPHVVRRSRNVNLTSQHLIFDV